MGLNVSTDVGGGCRRRRRIAQSLHLPSANLVIVIEISYLTQQTSGQQMLTNYSKIIYKIINTFRFAVSCKTEINFS